MNQNDSEKSFLGVGWAFPMKAEPTGKIETARYEEDIRQAIIIIIGTGHGERLMRPDFGAGLKQMVFEPVNTTTIALVKNTVERALITWETRIDVLEVSVSTDTPERNRIDIEVTYRVRATNAVQNMVYPFYILEGQGE
jgi:phage baseplate assembly protein W